MTVMMGGEETGREMGKGAIGMGREGIVMIAIVMTALTSWAPRGKAVVRTPIGCWRPRGGNG